MNDDRYQPLTGLEIVLIVGAVSLLGAAAMAVWARVADLMAWGA